MPTTSHRSVRADFATSGEDGRPPIDPTAPSTRPPAFDYRPAVFFPAKRAGASADACPAQP